MPKQRGRSRGGDASTSLNITSMMDMFTIILLFLLKSYSADGSMLTTSDKLILPNSISIEKPKNVKLQLAATPEWILLDNKSIVETDSIRVLNDSIFVNFAALDTTADGTITAEVEGKPTSLTTLEKELQMHMRAQEALLAQGDITAETKGQIIIQIDKNMPMAVVHNVMKICGRNKFNGMKFAVISRVGD